MHGVTTRWPKALDDVENAYQQLDEATLLAYPDRVPGWRPSHQLGSTPPGHRPPSDDRLGTS
jgi:hypothetical protein